MGAHHTLTLELNRNFTLEKECWDMIYLQRIDEACHPERQAEIAAVVMQASGLAHVVIVAGPITVTKAKIDITIPRKRTGSNDHSKSLTKFYEAIYQAILRHIDFNKIKCVICASPGFVKDEFYKYLLEQSVKRDDRIFIENKSKFLLCKASSGHLQALQEIFADIQVMSQIDDTMFAKEVLVLRKFMR
jgi:protein pelota